MLPERHRPGRVLGGSLDDVVGFSVTETGRFQIESLGALPLAILASRCDEATPAHFFDKYGIGYLQ
jgi:hypothetical protein